MRKYEDISFLVFKIDSKEEWHDIQMELLEKFDWVHNDKEFVHYGQFHNIGLCINHHNRGWVVGKLYSVPNSTSSTDLLYVTDFNFNELNDIQLFIKQLLELEKFKLL